MAISRFARIAGAMLLFATAQPAWSQSADCCSEATMMKGGAIRKTYSLAEISDDPAFGAWVAEMIPQIVQPGTWNTGEAPNRRVLSYFAPGKMLLVYHTPAAHAELEEFLRGVKKTLPSKTPAATAVKTPALFGLAQAQYTTADPRSEPMSGPNGYPVPAQPQQSKHLFHFIIRYEGVGVIDRNVVDFAKTYVNPTESRTPASNAPTPPATELPPPLESKDECSKPVKRAMPAMPSNSGPMTSAELAPYSSGGQIIPASATVPVPASQSITVPLTSATMGPIPTGYVTPASATVPAPTAAPRPVAPPEPIEESGSRTAPLRRY